MSVLRVHKKASTADEVLTLVNAAKRITHPFGYHVSHIQNNDFYTDRETAIRNLCKAFKKAAAEQAGLVTDTPSIFRPIIEMHEGFLERTQRKDNKTPFKQDMVIELKTDTVRKTVMAQFIIHAEEDLSLKSITGPYLKDVLDSEINRAVMQYFTLWHEQAHLTDCPEPQADMIGAIMCRQAIKDTTFLGIMADSRIIDTLYGIDVALEKYGWQTTQAIDYVCAMNQKDIDAITEDNMFEIACMDFEPYMKAVARASYAVNEFYERTYGTPDDGLSIKKALPVCKKLIEIDVFEPGSLENAYLTRLNFALQRASQPELYTKANRDVADIQTHTFITDVPEFLPAPSSLSLEQ